LKLAGRDIHRAFCRIASESPLWDDLPLVAQNTYNDLAVELNKMLEGDNITISAIKCPSCGAMLEDVKGHPCLLVGS